MSSIHDWSKTPADNATADANINWQEGQDSATVNNSSRQEMARVAEWRDDLAGISASAGTNNDFTVTLSSAVTAYFDGLTFAFKADRDNTGDATLNVNSIGAVPIRTQYGRPLIAREIRANSFVSARYNATGPYFEITGTAASGGDVATRAVAVGDIIISSAAAPRSGFVRLGQDIQFLNKADYPELNSWASAQGYEWGETGTTFGIPPAAAYGLRFAASDNTIDPDGPRNAGSIQQDEIKSHTHTGTTDGHSHRVEYDRRLDVAPPGGSGEAVQRLVATGGNFGVNDAAQTATDTFTSNATGGAETRGKNVAFHADMLAQTEEAFLAQLALTGLSYSFNADTADSNPGSGRLKFNNANPAAATFLYISNFDQFSVDVSGALSNISNFTIGKVSAPGEYIIMDLGTVQPATGYAKFPITNIDAVTAGLTISDGRNLQLTTAGVGPAGPQGPTGEQGPAGTSAGQVQNFDAGTDTGVDPGNGNFRISAGNNQIAFDDQNAAGATIREWLLSWGNSDNPPDKGRIIIKASANPDTVFKSYTVTSIVSQTGYVQANVTQDSAGGSFTATSPHAIEFAPSGNKGTDGAGAGNVIGTGPTVVGNVAVWNNTAGTGIQDGGTLGSLAAKDTVATADIDNDAVDNTKLANMAADTVKAGAPGGGDPVDLAIAEATFVARETGGNLAGIDANKAMGILDGATNAPARLDNAQTFTKGQRKQVTEIATWVTAWNIDDSNDFNVTAQISGAAGNFPIPTATGLANGEAQAGEITIDCAANTAGFVQDPAGVTGWAAPGGTYPDISAAGLYTLYYRIWKDSAGTVRNRITGLAAWG